ncbi:MAG: hypothetical protein NE328_18260 [Lentisphaeraceae bacterium]|nr:hypothetical protein [Lentisphaeraceae bacterium]
MSLWRDFTHFITFRPIPLSDSWVNLEDNCLTNDKKAPVSLVSIRFKPEKEELRKYISPGFLEEKFKEITDILMYFCTEEAKESLGFSSLQDDSCRFAGEITINWYAEGTGKRKGLYIKMSDDIDEPMELSIRQTITTILAPLKLRPEIGFSMEYKMGAAHPDWEPPEKFKDLSF